MCVRFCMVNILGVSLVQGDQHGVEGRVVLREVIVLLYDASKFTSTGRMAVANHWRLRGSPETSGF